MKGMLSNVVIIVGFILATHSQSLSSQREALEGSPDIYVLAQIAAEEEIDLGAIDKSWLKTKVELACRQYGVSIVDTTQYPSLHILLHVIQLGSDHGLVDFLYFSIHLTIKEKVLTYRSILNEELVGRSWENVKILEAFTWSETYLGGSSQGDFQDAITGAVKALMDEFLNDYLAANQAEEKKPSIYDIIGKDDE